MKYINIIIWGILASTLFCALSVSAEVMPYPTFDNSLIFGMVYYIEAGPSYVLPGEINSITGQFGKGLYAPLVFSRFVGVDMDWHTNPGSAGFAVQRFKDSVDLIIQKARFYKVGIHFILTYGLSRNTQFYSGAKEEDIRNAQWYNDNNILRRTQLNGDRSITDGFDITSRFGEGIADELETVDNATAGGVVNKYVFTTLSRYARKLRTHLEAKTTAAFNYLKQKQRENPDILFIISGPGEAELNFYGLTNAQALQTYFCDYSPFAVLEFRDWITHQGLYAPGNKYAGEGYDKGGTRYQGNDGLVNFNTDFRTGFTTWDLKYYNWNLEDPLDDNFQDNSNPDSHIISINEYRYDEMQPQTGEKTINGGFDPPRLMLPKGQAPFGDLWQTFREAMVYHYVKDIAAIAGKSGFPRKQYYSHQIPADYFEGTQPNNPDPFCLNARYYSSASPLWTAQVFNNMGMGISLYDINYGDRYADTSQYVIPIISAMSNNWAAVESNIEVIPSNIPAVLSPVDYLFGKMMRLYDYNIHFINFFKWNDNEQYDFKETNRGLAAKLFFDTVKDKARQSPDIHFTPKIVEGFTGNHRANTGSIQLNWSPKIWLDLNYNWRDWGDFKEFIIYRGYDENFPCTEASRLTGLTGNTYEDTSFASAGTIYYKLVAVNTMGEAGEPVSIRINAAREVRGPSLKISLHQLNFGAATREGLIPSKSFTVGNTGVGIMNWTARTDDDWISVTPADGINSGLATVTVNGTSKAGGTYTGTITVSAPGATDAPQTITVTMVIYPTGVDGGPFGKLELPVQGSLVHNTVSFTGWALDDIGVKSVRIYLLQKKHETDQNNPVFVGEAILVAGARPDIARAYPDYPNNHKAGWSYIMLTRNLPNQGNGVFTFKVIALDGAGHETTLGTRTINCSNSISTSPFGTIDTPQPGEVISSKSYRNQGWVLTPLPNLIPEDGSTIEIYIDGIYRGRPVYNIYRPDVAALLPGYVNSNRAHAYFDIDTTTLKNGGHMIHWLVRDNAGNMSIIGSRKFTILNPGGHDHDPVSRNNKPGGKK